MCPAGDGVPPRQPPPPDSAARRPWTMFASPLLPDLGRYAVASASPQAAIARALPATVLPSAPADLLTLAILCAARFVAG